jgi:tetratricopeptide (TPR) repeat protein
MLMWNGSRLPGLLRRLIFIAGCSLVVCTVVACREQAPPTLESLIEIKDIRAEEQRAVMKQSSESERLKERSEKILDQQALLNEVRAMTLEDIERLESELKTNPESAKAREKLLYRYGLQSGGQAVIDSQTIIARRREHILWLIEHHPDSDLLGRSFSRISPAGAFQADSQGYEMARKLWLSQTARPEAAAASLANAAYFFEVTDKATAEKLLVKLRSVQPDDRWTLRLGRLYGFALLGVTEAETADSADLMLGGFAFIRAMSDVEEQSDFAKAVRGTLSRSKDAQLVDAVAQNLLLDRRREPTLARTYLERVIQLDPKIVGAHRQYLGLRYREADKPVQELLLRLPKESRFEAVMKLPDADRFAVLRQLTQSSYSEANSLEILDRETAKAKRQQARQYAEELLKLAAKFPSDERHSGALLTGNIIAGITAARDGDSETAVKYLRAATTIPASEEMAYAPPSPPHNQLCLLLAGSGYRDDAIAFVEHFASINLSQRDNLLIFAAGLRSRK